MFQSITFYVGEKTLGIYGEEFPLGALTTEVLNITPEEYQALDSRLQSAMEGMARYEKTHTLTDWHRVNAQMLLLNKALCRHRIFRLIQTDAYILAEAKQLTEVEKSAPVFIWWEILTMIPENFSIQFQGKLTGDLIIMHHSHSWHRMAEGFW